jgi:transposase-like protein
MKIEVLGTERRRRWSAQDKLQIVEETMQPAQSHTSGRTTSQGADHGGAGTSRTVSGS